MGAKTKIDWCDATWNPVTGCLHDCQYYHGTFDVKRPDDFCSYGVKKGGGEENAAD